MFDTTILKSLGSTVWRMMSSILATYSLVTSMRVPVGALRLIVNCPASVCGKNANPSRGYRPRLAANNSSRVPTVTAGQRNAARVLRREQRYNRHGHEIRSEQGNDHRQG